MLASCKSNWQKDVNLWSLIINSIAKPIHKVMIENNNDRMSDNLSFFLDRAI